MRISIKRQLAIRLAVAVGFAAAQAILATTALATSSHTHHHSARAASSANHSSWGNPAIGYATDPATVLSPRYNYPNPFAGECTEDEGYGRFKPCDSGP
jgi:hypothetical protein